ncbi:MAG: UDP-N-acetyl-3-dehydro-alpha-D-glucosamine 3-aminotransferase [Desulfuromonadales bacterium]|nr:UDP-N-acetyl-3-dehydro-alpha-D-glucosamine 3-aminotransferase [Desulfuromonadales bacterium]
MSIPMVDLKGQYDSIKDEINRGLLDVLESTRFVLGPQGEALEQEIAAYCGVRHAFGVASGTDALHLALRAAGVGPGDEVITTAFTFIATAEAIAYVGATPVFVDIDPATFNIDVAKIENAISERTRAVIPVHLFGQPAELQALEALCRKHDLRMVEDCAQSFGADYQGRMTGAWGDLGCFSFFPSKNLGCYGDGGMIVTDDEQLADRIRMLRNHGSRERYYHAVIGYNSRLDDLQAVVLRTKLKYIDSYNRQRRQNAALYNARLGDSSVTIPVEDGLGTHVFHQYTIRVRNRHNVQQVLAEQGIASAIYYPVPLHLQEVFAGACDGLSLPVTEQAAEEVLSLPMYPELKEEQIDQICKALMSAL